MRFLKTMFLSILLFSLFETASSTCCEDIRSAVEQKELAHKKLCSNVSSVLDQCCQSLRVYIKKQREAYKTLCPVLKQFHANFTNLGAKGRFGPTSLGSHYVGKDHENMVTVVGGIQYWTVPYTGTYQITAVGAPGGYDTFSSSVARGRGAYMRGEFDLSKGDVVKILVGQEGLQHTLTRSSGGGGGSFVATASNTPLIVAGGGGGIQSLKTSMTNCSASTRTSGRQNQCLNPCPIWPGGVNGSGASEVPSFLLSGGGGGGFYSNGTSGLEFGGDYGDGGEGGRGFIQGGAGGRGVQIDVMGGFGGGGGGVGNGVWSGGPGGGGGFSGGGESGNNDDSCGGGAGSYNKGKNQVNQQGYLASGDGYVEIELMA